MKLPLLVICGSEGIWYDIAAATVWAPQQQLAASMQQQPAAAAAASLVRRFKPRLNRRTRAALPKPSCAGAPV
jgi:hypothetical protein